MSAEFDARERRDMRMVPDKFDGRKWTFRPQAPADRIRFMARHSGYVMVRKPGCMPFVMTEREWARLPLWSAPAPETPTPDDQSACEASDAAQVVQPFRDEPESPLPHPRKEPHP